MDLAPGDPVCGDRPWSGVIDQDDVLWWSPFARKEQLHRTEDKLDLVLPFGEDRYDHGCTRCIVAEYLISGPSAPSGAQHCALASESWILLMLPPLSADRRQAASLRSAVGLKKAFFILKVTHIAKSALLLKARCPCPNVHLQTWK
jgi:hypothetical protein